MSPALVKKYLSAAREVASIHGPDGRHARRVRRR
jgi:hypothetical protein